jgi:hypothetical protein
MANLGTLANPETLDCLLNVLAADAATLSATDRKSNSAWLWNSMPIPQRTAPSLASRLPTRCSPSTSTLTRSGFSSPHQLAQHGLARRRRADQTEPGARREVKRHAGEHIAPAVALVDVAQPERARLHDALRLGRSRSFAVARGM